MKKIASSIKFVFPYRGKKDDKEGYAKYLQNMYDANRKDYDTDPEAQLNKSIAMVGLGGLGTLTGLRAGHTLYGKLRKDKDKKKKKNRSALWTALGGVAGGGLGALGGYGLHRIDRYRNLKSWDKEVTDAANKMNKRGE
jgi:hypothetical protein